LQSIYVFRNERRLNSHPIDKTRERIRKKQFYKEQVLSNGNPIEQNRD